MDDCGQLRLSGGVRRESLFHGGDAGARIKQSVNFGLAQNQNFTAHPQSLTFPITS
jgi:hypothetical protein